MSYYLETRISPHGIRRIVGGQATDGMPLVVHATREDAQAAVSSERRRLFAEPMATDTAGRAPITEVNIRALDDLRIPGTDRYMHMG